MNCSKGRNLVLLVIQAAVEEVSEEHLVLRQRLVVMALELSLLHRVQRLDLA